MRRFVSWKNSIAGLLVAVVCGAALVWWLYPQRYTLLQSPTVQRFIPIYHSLRKIPDALFVPYAVFSQSELEHYELVINPNDIERMNFALPDDPFGSNILTDANKLWVGATFRAPGYEGRVKVRYRGNLANHWNAFKKSYLVKFPKDALYQGMREIVLVIPHDRGYFLTTLNHERARRLGLLVPQEWYATMSLNGGVSGVYLTYEHWSQEWLEKHPIASDSLLLGVDGATLSPDTQVYSPEGLLAWKSWNSEFMTPYEPVQMLTYVVRNTSDEEFVQLIPRIVDVEQFIARDVMNILAGNNHNTASGGIGTSNLIVYFDRTEGRFKPIPYNTSMHEYKEAHFMELLSLLQKRLFSHKPFKEARDARLLKYLEEDTDIDRQLVDEWIDRMNKEFYMDHAKLQNNFMYRSYIHKYRTYMEGNIASAPTQQDVVYPSPLVEPDSGLTVPRAYAGLLKAIQTPQQFREAHPQFHMREDGLHLYAGWHRFTQNVIVPQGTHLTVHAGATMAFDPQVSLISYSPVDLFGSDTKPVRVEGVFRDKPWGVFVVANTETASSSFAHARFVGGGEMNIHGMTVTGMLALHNADGSIQHSSFGLNYGDDGVNVKGGHVVVRDNLFFDTYSDGIDVDFPEMGTTVTDNRFMRIGGDAIDLSWSNITIATNTIAQCQDKGVSVGENSSVRLEGNSIADCDMGVAIKDLSEAEITENVFTNNHVAIAAYQKKPIFGGGTAHATKNIFHGNQSTSTTDAASTVVVE